MQRRNVIIFRNIIFRKSAFVDMPRDAGDFSLLDRKVVNVIKAMPERDRFVRGLRAWAGFRSIGVSYHRDARHAGETSNNLAKSVWWAKKAIFTFSLSLTLFSCLLLSLGPRLMEMLKVLAFLLLTLTFILSLEPFYLIFLEAKWLYLKLRIYYPVEIHPIQAKSW